MQDEPPTWPSGSDDDLGLESLSEPDDMDFPADEEDGEEGGELVGEGESKRKNSVGDGDGDDDDDDAVDVNGEGEDDGGDGPPASSPGTSGPDSRRTRILCGRLRRARRGIGAGST